MSDNFPKVLISLCRNVYPNMVAADICSVQPMYDPVPPFVRRIEHTEGSTFTLYGDHPDTIHWLSQNCQWPFKLVLKELIVEKSRISSIFALKVRYSGISPVSKQEAVQTLTFESLDAALYFKLMWCGNDQT